MNVGEMYDLPNENHSIVECTISIFLEKPFSNLDMFENFYSSHLKNDFSKLETVNSFEMSVNPMENRVDQKKNGIVGFKLFKIADEKSKVIIQISNERTRQFLSIHSLNYSRWEDFKKEFNQILKVFDKWIENKVRAFSLHYIDQFILKDSKQNCVPYMFNPNSDFLPKRFLNSQESFLVFNSKIEEEDDKYELFDRVEIRTDKNRIGISQNSIIPVGTHDSFTSFTSCDECREKIDTAHERNKTLLRDILSKEVLNNIGIN